MKKIIDWSRVEEALVDLEEVKGGYTSARRGLIEIDEIKYFVKIAADELTKQWLLREIEVYTFLQQIGFNDSPELVSYSTDRPGICLRALTADEGWDWSNSYSVGRVESTLKLIDKLDSLGSRKAQDLKLFSDPDMSKEKFGWSHIFTDDGLRLRIFDRLDGLGFADVVGEIKGNLTKLQQVYSEFNFNLDTLVHLDIRGDNCGWNEAENKSMMIDWNWCDLSDKRVDRAAFLTNVQVSGIDIVDSFPDYLDAGAFFWLAGFWFEIILRKSFIKTSYK